MPNTRDLHKSLKSEVLREATLSGVRLALVKLAWGKNDTAFSLHVAPTMWSTSGFQIPDLLSYIGFLRQPCLFLKNECYVKEVPEGFDLNRFGTALGDAYQQMNQAQRHLEQCGFILNQPEGWGYFFGKRGSGHTRRTYYGDGHTSAIAPKVMKIAEDDAFRFVFTWIENGEQDMGWTIHYRPKHPPLSVELQSVFNFLGINDFHECPQFDFEPCSWRHIVYHQRGNNLLDSNAESAHRYFEAYEQHFSPGIKALLTSQEEMEKVGMGFLSSFERPELRRTKEITRRIEKVQSPKNTASGTLSNFDLAISFAGTERKLAEDLAIRVRAAGFQVFYDDFFPEELWGKDLGVFFHEIYSKSARYCVIFVSNEYLNREWTVHERRSAQERMLREKGNEYILPIKVEDVELPGISSTIGYLPITTGIEHIAEILVKKLEKK
jgi:hypothetical protein